MQGLFVLRTRAPSLRELRLQKGTPSYRVMREPRTAFGVLTLRSPLDTVGLAGKRWSLAGGSRTSKNKRTCKSRYQPGLYLIHAASSDRNPEGLPELRPTPTQKLLSTTVETSWFPKTLEPGSVPPSSRDGGVMRDPIQGAIRQGQRTSDRWLDSDTIPRTPPVMDASIFRVGDLSVLRMCVLEILVRATYAG